MNIFDKEFSKKINNNDSLLDEIKKFETIINKYNNLQRKIKCQIYDIDFPNPEHQNIDQINLNVYKYNGILYKKLESKNIYLDIMINNILSEYNIIPRIKEIHICPSSTDNKNYLIILMSIYNNLLYISNNNDNIEEKDNIIIKYKKLLEFIFNLGVLYYDFKPENTVIRYIEEYNKIRIKKIKLIDIDYNYFIINTKMNINIYNEFNINLLKLGLISLYEEEFENFNFFYDTVFEYLYKYYVKDDENIRRIYINFSNYFNTEIEINNDEDKKKINSELLYIINNNTEDEDEDEIYEIIWPNIDVPYISLYKVYYYYYFFIKFFNSGNPRDQQTFECNPLRYYKNYINKYLLDKNYTIFQITDRDNKFFKILINIQVSLY